MKHQHSLSAIDRVENGFLFYDAGDMHQINIKESAMKWWSVRVRKTLMGIILREKQKNIYAGDKCFNLSQPYIRLYAGDDEIVFTQQLPDDLDTSDVCELRAFWDDINVSLNKQGFWLFDEG